jgi:hypothetical protein
LRGIHYLLASAANIVKPDGTLYVNTFADWSWLVGRAAKCARWLGHVPFDAFDDSRNEARYHRSGPSHPFPSEGSGLTRIDNLPSFCPPRVWLYGFDPRQAYAFAITQRIWNAPKIAAIRGFMPLLERCFSIAMRSGRAAKVVPAPATKPTI